MKQRPDGLWVLGTVTLDTLELPSGEFGPVAGGSAMFAALGASSVRTCAILGVAGIDFPPEAVAALSERGVDVSGLSLLEGPTFRWHARYSDDLASRTTLGRDQGVGTTVPATATPSSEPEWGFLGSMDPETQGAVLRERGAVSYGLDTMAHWIQEKRPSVDGLLKDAHTLFVSDHESTLLGGASDPESSVRALLESGVRQVVLKAGAHGARLYHRDGWALASPAVPGVVAIDPTGAGDSLAGAFMAVASMGNEQPEMALAAGAAAASLAIEGVSFQGFLRASDGEFDRRTQVALQLIESLKG